MPQFQQVYTRFQGIPGSVTGLPLWGRVLIAAAALPGLILAGLSIVAFVVSLLALFLLTVPVYRLVRTIAGGPRKPQAGNGVVEIIDPADADYGSPGRKPVQGTLIE